MSTTSQVTNNQTFSISDRYYTGTKENPDVVTVFFKPKVGGEIYSYDEQITNEMGYLPLHQTTFLTACYKMHRAVNNILHGEPSELCNACKNLSRAVTQFVPFIGNGILYLYDLARKNLFIHPQLKAELANEQSPVFGIAFDGKPVIKLDLSVFRTKFPSTRMEAGKEKEAVALLTYIWLELKGKALADERNFTNLDLANQLQRVLTNGRPC
jgi:hypothetical protein